MKVTNSPTPLPSSAACSAPVRTSADSGRTRCDRVDQLLLADPLARGHGDSVESRLAQHAASGLDVEESDRRSAEAADVAEAGDAGEREGATGPSPATLTVSPTLKPCSSAVLRSTTTWCGPAAQSPSTSLKGLNRSSAGSMPRPKVGLFPWIALPFLSRIFAWFESPERSRIVPAAASTSGSARTRREHVR